MNAPNTNAPNANIQDTNLPDRRVTLHVWRVRRRDIGAAIARMATDPRRLRRDPRVRFVKLLGTAAGFGLTHADPCRWAAFTVWHGAPVDGLYAPWHRLATAACRLDLAPQHSRGTWAGTAFDDLTSPAEPNPANPNPADAPAVLALTHARLRPGRAITFWRAIGPVAASLRTAGGSIAAFGIGEAPIGWQGTVSVWAHRDDLLDFAYRHARHRQAIAASTTGRWYAEELFARFAVIDTSGDLGVIGWGRTGKPA